MNEYMIRGLLACCLFTNRILVRALCLYAEELNNCSMGSGLFGSDV